MMMLIWAGWVGWLGDTSDWRDARQSLGHQLHQQHGCACSYFACSSICLAIKSLQLNARETHSYYWPTKSIKIELHCMLLWGIKPWNSFLQLIVHTWCPARLLGGRKTERRQTRCSAVQWMKAPKWQSNSIARKARAVIHQDGIAVQCLQTEIIPSFLFSFYHLCNSIHACMLLYALKILDCCL